jgi:hypothetical protein
MARTTPAATSLAQWIPRYKVERTTAMARAQMRALMPRRPPTEAIRSPREAIRAAVMARDVWRLGKQLSRALFMR